MDAKKKQGFVIGLAAGIALFASSSSPSGP